MKLGIVGLGFVGSAVKSGLEGYMGLSVIKWLAKSL